MIDAATGDNLNSGIYGTTNTYSGAGDWDGTSVFTPNDGSTPASFISVGDYISVYVSGDTVARYVAQVTVVAAGVNGAVTVSTTIKYGTAPASSAGAHTSRIKRGGVWASQGLMNSPGLFNAASSVPQSTRVSIKVGTYANTTSNRVCAMAGTAQFPLRFQGCKVTPGDQEGVFQAVAGTDIPAITTTTGSFAFSGANVTLVNLDFNGAPVGSLLTCSAARWKLQEVRLVNTSANAAAVAFTGSQIGVATACYFQCPTTATKMVSQTTGSGDYIGCVFNGGITGLLNSAAGSGVYLSLFYGQGTGDCISTSNNATFIFVYCYAPGGNGINFTGVGSGSIVANCYFSTVTTAAKAGVMNSTGTNVEDPTLLANAFFNCTANYGNFQEPYQFMDNGTLASEAFNNPGSQDFSLKAAYYSLGYPGQFENFAASRGYASFGAMQPQASASGGIAHLAGAGGGLVG